MSRRKQPNPKSIKDAIDKLVEKKLVDFKNETANGANLTQGFIDGTLKAHTNTNNFLEIESKKYTEANEQNFLKEKEKAEFNDDEDEIDVENVSDKEDCFKDEPRRAISSCTNRSPSPIGSVKSESSSKSSENYEKYARNIKQEEEAKASKSGVIQPVETCKAVHRQRFNVNLQKQNTQSVIINGKRYYPLKFKCEDCDLRYSDQSTLDTHKQNYCSKRNQTPSVPPQTQSVPSSILAGISSTYSSSSSSSITSSSESSRSNSPTTNTQKFKTLQIPNEQFEQRFNISKENRLINHQQGQQHLSNINADTNNAPMLKSVIYQCNYCPFQTDKKCIMNKHSRVHLPQKRRAMEEATFYSSSSSSSTSSSLSSSSSITNGSISEKNDQEIGSSSTSSDKQNSYCTDCDIQFSSVKTFLHHRNNYCQKYKTIESFVPIESITSAKKISSDPIEQKLIGATIGIDTISNIRSDENKEALLVPQPAFKRGEENGKNFSNFPLTPTNAVRMGDTVYVPLYKLPIDESSLKQAPHTPEPSERNDPTVKPLDLTLKNKISQTGLNGPLDLSIKNPIIGDLNADQIASVNLEQMYALSKLAYPFPFSILKDFYSLKSNPNASILDNMSNLNNQLKLELLRQSLNIKNYNFLIKNLPEYEFYLDMINNTHQRSSSNEVKLNPIKCPNCQQIFMQLSELRHHKCMLLKDGPKEERKELEEEKEEDQENERKSVYLKRRIHNEMSDEDRDEEIEEQNFKSMKPTNNNNKNIGYHLRMDPDLLKLETVQTTLIETYGCKNISELLKLSQNEFVMSNQNNNQVKNFYICTSCGYRGNTQRGVKQHGKLHLSNGQHFAVIYASDCQPMLVYNSEDDGDLSLKLNRHQQQQPQLAFKVAKDEEVLKIKLNEEQVERNKCRTNEKYEVSAEQSTDKPISKKARLLNFKQEEVNQLNIVHIPNQIAPKSDKSQTYCHKCDIQFQRMNNYLAHKKSYCKDD